MGRFSSYTRFFQRTRSLSSFSRVSGGFAGGRNPRFVPYYVYAIGGGGVVLLGSLGYTYYTHLDRAPLTGRRRWIATTAEWEASLGHAEYKQLLHQYHPDILPPQHRASITLHRVGAAIAASSLQFAQRHGLQSYVETYKNNPYTFTVVKSDSVANAFVLPGNHVFLFTGLLRYIHSEDELAAVLGHEVAHNLARHAGEKISGGILLQLLGMLAWWVDPSGALYYWLVPAAALFRELPNSRTQEMEADQIGLQITAGACYEPQAAKRLFVAMSQDDKGSTTGPEFLSTHPSHATRIEQIDEWIPHAVRQVRLADEWYDTRCQSVRDRMRHARQLASEEASARERKEEMGS